MWVPHRRELCAFRQGQHIARNCVLNLVLNLKLAVSKGNNTIETVENTNRIQINYEKGRSFLPLLSQQSGKASYNTYTRQQ